MVYKEFIKIYEFVMCYEKKLYKQFFVFIFIVFYNNFIQHNIIDESLFQVDRNPLKYLDGPLV